MELPVWPRVTDRATSAVPTPVDYQSIKARLDDVAGRLFKQDGTVEVMACHWSKHRRYTIISVIHGKTLSS